MCGTDLFGSEYGPILDFREHERLLMIPYNGMHFLVRWVSVRNVMHLLSEFWRSTCGRIKHHATYKPSISASLFFNEYLKKKRLKRMETKTRNYVSAQILK